MERNESNLKILVSIFTYDKNIWLLKGLLESYEKAQKDLNIVLVIIDFSEIPGKVEEFVGNRGIVVSLPNSGFCQNFNFCRMMVLTGGYDVYFCLNDDIRIHEYFFMNALQRFSEGFPTLGFIGGTSQIGGWLEDPENAKIPKPRDYVVVLDNIARLNWEFSACGFTHIALKAAGQMDYMFSPQLGLCADNDYLHMIRLNGFRTVRDHNVTFWHRKASTQSELRCPWGKDPHRKRAVKFMKLKWGCDIDDPEVTKAVYEVPFDGKKIVQTTDKFINIAGEIHYLEEE